MKPNFINTLALAAAGWLTAGLVHADIPLPVSNFTDGPLIRNSATPTNICIDLSQAVTGVWTDSTVGTNQTRGIYDPEKWAIVFKYTSVNIGANVTICFTNHPSHAPVVWIVQGDVTINGRVSLDGEPGNTFARHTEPGPGGGYGGIGETSDALPASDGFGWGGGIGSTVGGAGSYANFGANYFYSDVSLPVSANGMPGPIYGTASCVPLRGGCGGSGSGEPGLPAGYPQFGFDRSVLSGGAGGGAFLIIAGRNVIVNGALSANGGPAVAGPTLGLGGGGSGGAIRLVAESVIGSGRLIAYGTSTGISSPRWSNSRNYDAKSTGGSGRIRIETVRNQLGGLTTLPGASVVPLSGTPQLWPAPAAPAVRIFRVAQTAITSTPLGNIDSGFTDAQVNAGPNETEVIIEGANLATNAVVELRLVPKFGRSEVVTASFCSECGPASGTTNYWRAAF